MIESTPTRTWVVIGFVVVGTFFLTVGTIGLLRLPNVYNRMHATSKPATIGTVAIFLAGFVYFRSGGCRPLVAHRYRLPVPDGADRRAHDLASGGTDRGPVPRVGDVAGEVRRRVGELPTIVD